MEVMRRNLRLTLVPHLTVVAYFSIANIFIPCTCWPAKRSGSLICIYHDRDLMPEDECRSAKGCQSLMKEEGGEEGGASDMARW
jgi:hypothetical protein